MTTGDKPTFTVIDRRFSAKPEEPAGPGRKPSHVAELEAKLKANEESLAVIRARHEAAVREFEEARARMLRDVSQEIERGKLEIVAELLDVLDNLDRAIEVAKERPDLTAIIHGMELIQSQFIGKLRSLGVTRIDAKGQPFDPNLHQAVSSVPTRDPAQDGMVVGVIRPAYTAGDRVLRPAMVAVGSTETGRDRD